MMSSFIGWSHAIARDYGGKECGEMSGYDQAALLPSGCRPYQQAVGLPHGTRENGEFWSGLLLLSAFSFVTSVTRILA